jgi:SLT domain-containing protein
MQLTDPVFERHQLPGYGNIWQPVDNLVAGIVFRMALLSQVQRRTANPA